MTTTTTPEEQRNVSWSEIQTWCTCRMKWYWSYQRRITPKRTPRAPSVGSCGHAAIAAALRGEDWSKAVDGWLQEELNKTPLFDEDIAERQSIADLIKGIVPRYLRQYNDTFTTVLVEQHFEIPISGMSLHLAGYWDAIVRDSAGHLWLLEHKFPQQRFRTDDDLELDGQIGVYQYAAHRLGYPVVGTIFNQLLGKLPAVPKLNKDGSLSRARICSDWPTYCETATQHGLHWADYIDMREKLADFQFFQRNYIYRPLVEVRLFSRDMERRIWDMRRAKKHIYRNESFLLCNRCSYRELCLESVKGGDVDDIITNQFEPKSHRKEEAPQDDAQIEVEGVGYNTGS